MASNIGKSVEKQILFRFYTKLHLFYTNITIKLNKKRFFKLIVLILIFNILVILLVNNRKLNLKVLQYCSSARMAVLSNQRDEQLSNTKTILFWNGLKRSELTIFGTGHDTFVQHGCPVSDCEIVNSPHQYPYRPLEDYDAILFNFNDEFWMTKRPQFQRRPHQRFIFFTQEPPPSIEPMNVADYDGYFNWTMTYRMDSDIPLLYGRIKPKITSPISVEKIQTKINHFNRSSVTRKNTKKKESYIAAMISHCETHGGREAYIKKLQKYIKIDIYGRCTDEGFPLLHCDPDELLSSSPECYDMLASKYKFYLSFENSICPDYVTEKFFQIASRHIVPVVYGGANYSRIAPTHSYINALNYKPKALAAYLKLLANNESLYNEYFWWKEFYVVEAGLGQMIRNSFCDLCRKLHEDDQLKAYRSLKSEWDSVRCQKPTYLLHRGRMENPPINLSSLNMLKYYFHRSY